jgi:hypothetical protein
MQDYHVDGDGNVVPLPNTGSPLIAPNQMSHARVRLAQSTPCTCQQSVQAQYFLFTLLLLCLSLRCVSQRALDMNTPC